MLSKHINEITVRVISAWMGQHWCIKTCTSSCWWALGFCTGLTCFSVLLLLLLLLWLLSLHWWVSAPFVFFFEPPVRFVRWWLTAVPAARWWNPKASCIGAMKNRHSTRWLNGTLLSPNWRSLNRLKGHSTMPEKATLNHQLLTAFLLMTSFNLILDDWYESCSCDVTAYFEGFILLRNSSWKGNHQHEAPMNRWLTLQGTNISPQNGILKMIFLFPRWDMLIPWTLFKEVVFFPPSPVARRFFGGPKDA